MMSNSMFQRSLFDKKVVVVTGSTKGIGLAIAQHYSRHGASVILCGRDKRLRPDVMNQFADEQRVAYFSGDLAEHGRAEDLITFAVDRFGQLDIVVNNAGFQPQGGMASGNVLDWEKAQKVNVIAPAAVLHEAARKMRENDDGGTIINIASIRGIRPGTGMAAYSASKAALIALTTTAAAEYGPDNIRVYAISPGLIDRPGLDVAWPEGVEQYSNTAPLGRIGKPEDIAQACLFLSSNAASWITGINLTIDGGMTLVK